MTNIPWKLLEKWAAANGISGFAEGSSAVGMVMLPQDGAKAAQAKKLLEESCVAEGLKVLGWRSVPVDNAVVGPLAKLTCPVHEHPPRWLRPGPRRVRVQASSLVRREKKANADAEMAESFYICTLSSRTIVYKGMLRSAVLGKFYKDLEDPEYESQFAIYLSFLHQHDAEVASLAAHALLGPQR